MKHPTYHPSFLLILVLLMANNPTFAQNEATNLSGWIYVQYRFDQNEATQNSVLQIRRARLDYKGSLTPWVDFRLQVDFAPSPRLIDAYTKLKFKDYLQLQVGQFKIPFSLENKLSPLDLELIDNAQVINALSGYKDITGITYGVGLFGGNGINVKSDNLAKDISARLDLCPLVRNMTLSVSGYWGNYEMLYTNIPTQMNGIRNRYAYGAQYADEHWMIRAEYLKGLTGFVGYNETDGKYTPYSVESQGCYLTTRYWFFYNRRPTSDFRPKISPMMRVEYYDKDIAANTSSMFYSTGVDWWPEKHLRLQLAYTVQQKQSSEPLGHTLSTMITVKF